MESTLEFNVILHHNKFDDEYKQIKTSPSWESGVLIQQHPHMTCKDKMVSLNSPAQQFTIT